MLTLSGIESAAVDQAAASQAGIPTLLLMEHAALALAERVKAKQPESGTRCVHIICGPGNNGGDGFALARLLWGRVGAVCLYESDALFDRPPAGPADSPGDADVNRSSCGRLGIPRRRLAELTAGSGIYVDCLYGSGFKLDYAVTDEAARYQEVLAEARLLGGWVIACDLPSGTEAGSGLVSSAVITADETVSFAAAKTGIISWPGRGFAGKITVGDLGLPPGFAGQAVRSAGYRPVMALAGEDIAAWRPERTGDANKGDFGKALIRAGSPGMAGAAVLAARACSGSGAGLTRVLVEDSLVPGLLDLVPSSLIHALPNEPEAASRQWQEALGWASAVLIGPGLGQPAGTDTDTARLKLALRQAKRLVLDADALNRLAAWGSEGRELLRARTAAGLDPAVLTPHPGEFSRLCPEAYGAGRPAGEPEGGRIEAARRYARETESVIVLKGAGTVIALPPACQEETDTWINTSGNPGMAKGGSGDLLSGILVSLLAQGLPLDQAVGAGVWLHGRAADLAAEQCGERALTAEAQLDGLPLAFRQAGW